jgi:prepilin-type N-terminal cleavage/methylation domain-containing protein
MTGTDCRQGRARAFTLVEILIVVLIVAILAAIVLPQFQAPREDARQIAFITDVQFFAEAAKLYRIREGEHLEDSASGAVPAGWETYIDTRKWTRLTPLGGVWDVELNSFGITSALGVDFANGDGEDRDDVYMLEVDKTCDDGNLATGQFRKIADGRYYYILMP